MYPQRAVGGRLVPPIGLGTMLMTLPHPPPGIHEEPIEESQAIRTIHAALDGGVRLIDTAINYCMAEAEMGRNERLVAKALRSWSGDTDEVLVVCKGGNRRTDDEPAVRDGRPENLRWSCDTSLRALNVDSLGLYMLHAPDPAVRLADSFGTLADLQQEGKIQMVGASNLGRRELAEARAIVDIVAVENQLAPTGPARLLPEVGRMVTPQAALPLARLCAQEEIAFLAWGPLGGQVGATKLAKGQPAIAAIADRRGVSPQQIALAWGLAQAPSVIPIPAARRPETILDSLKAWDVELSEEELAAIDTGLLVSPT
jgi:aryl-alcohol dehydrogenase-like predicted oxidoreductase